MEKDIKNKIKNWVSEQGYPLEMKVAEIFQKYSFHVNLSSYYKDSKENIFREIDVVAMNSIGEIHKTTFDVRFVIECKYSADKPWILFQSNSDIELRKNFEISRRFASKYGEIALLELSNNKEAQNNFLFSIPDQMSYGVTRAFENSTDMTFKALTSVLKATNYFVTQFDSINSDSFIGFIAIAFPIIVIDSKLYNCKLDTNNEVEISEADIGYLLMRNEEYGNFDSIVTIVTFKALSGYITALNNACEKLEPIIKNGTPNLHKFVKKINRQIIGIEPTILE